MKTALAISLLFFTIGVGCSDDHAVDGGTDLSAQAGDGGARDLSHAGDSGCVHQTFGGFLGISPNERRVDCTCGCDVDTFEAGGLSGIWNAATGAAGIVPMAGVGLELDVQSSGAPAVVAINSLSPTQPFYVDGDFDLLVDWKLAAPPSPGAHLVLNLADKSGTVNGAYTIARDRTGAGADQLSATLGGITPVEVATTTQMGTLEIARSGFTVRALADGNLVSQFTGGSTGRLSIQLSAALDGCAQDGGACQLSVVWHRMRMMGGALVDRR